METETIESKVASLIEKGVIDIGYWYRTDEIAMSLSIENVESLQEYVVKNDRFDVEVLGSTCYFTPK